MNKKTIVVACASSMITSTIASNKIRSIATENNLPEPKIIQVKFSEIQGALSSNDVDFIIPTGKLDENDFPGYTIIPGMPFITGVGEEELKQKIEDELKK